MGEAGLLDLKLGPLLLHVQGLAVWRGAQARCDFAEALRFPAVLPCGAQQILQIVLILPILLPSD